MQFGIFDHLDRSGVPLGQQYEDRLRLIEAYDALGFDAYHLAEHHSTPLGMAPSPNIFLAAIGQRTRRLRFGPLVYQLPLYHPLRIAEEIAMLDHMSGGRLDIGFGRGISQFETAYYGVDPEETKARYEEELGIVLAALQGGTLTHKGRFHFFEETPVVLPSLQQPHPRMFYGAGHPEAAAWAAARGINIVCNAALARVKPIFERYREAWQAGGGASAGLPLLGINRHCVVADTDEAAQRIAGRAYKVWCESFYMIWNMRGARPNNATYPDTFEGLQEAGFGIAGSPETVREFYVREVGAVGANYAMGRFAFGDMSLEEARRSATLFSEAVMPALDEISP